MVIEIEHRDEVCVLHMTGRLITGEDPEYLAAKSDEVKARKCTKLLADLRSVPSIGSTGIGFLVGLYSSVTKNPNGRFVMVGPSPRVLEVLNLTRLSTVIPIAPDPAAGFAVLGIVIP
jgi:anti-anti-sigma factor